MKDHLLQQMESVPTDQRLNRAREYLQIYLLRSLHEIKWQSKIAFVGGTALRILHQLPRFSEDMDFSLIRNEDNPPDENTWLDFYKRLKKSLGDAAYDVEVKAKVNKTATSAFFRFRGLPKELGWSADSRISLSIKLDIDTNPPVGADLETTLVQHFFPVAVVHHDLPSLFSGKLHALLARRYTKGRDWFDLVWYLTEMKGLNPNYTLLTNALAQTGNTKTDGRKWRSYLRERIEQLDWNAVIKDLEPFVERRFDLEHIKPELISKLLSK